MEPSGVKVHALMPICFNTAGLSSPAERLVKRRSLLGGIVQAQVCDPPAAAASIVIVDLPTETRFLSARSAISRRRCNRQDAALLKRWAARDAVRRMCPSAPLDFIGM